MTANKPFFTAIIPTYNRWPVVKDAIDSILKQTFDDFELIIVDDGSTDETAQRLKGMHCNLRLIIQKNAGVSASRNAGIRKANGKWIAFLDSDDIWLPKKLESQNSYILSNPDTMILHCDEIWQRNGTRVNPKMRHRKAGSGAESRDSAFCRSLEMCLISPSTVVIKKDVFNKVGLFDEELPVCEDYDLWLRIMVHFTIHYLDQKLGVKKNSENPSHAASQLSASIKCQDIFRVDSLEKLTNNPSLPEDWVNMVLNEIVRKTEILTKGCIKRGRAKEAKEWRDKAIFALATLKGKR
jgi:glycosyltransferase involved in cell wall biosynthesis